MKNKILDNLCNKIKETYNYNDTKIKEIRYGLETLYMSVVKGLIILIISFFTHTTIELCVFYISFAGLRLTGFGLHAKNSIECWVLSVPLFTIIPYLIKIITLDNKYYLLLLLFIALLLIYAPADTEKRPLINKKKRNIYKLLTITISIIYFIIILITKNIIIKNAFSFSIILESILVIPISYKLLGLKYSNYKEYKRKEDIK